MLGASSGHPFTILSGHEHRNRLGGRCWQLPPFSSLPCRFELHLPKLGRNRIVKTLTAFEDKRVKIDEGTDLIWDAIGHAADDTPSIRMAAQNDFFEFFRADEVHDIGDVCFKVNLRRQ